MKKSLDIKKEESPIIFYVADDLKTIINIIFEEETFWISQKQMAELFDVEVNTINYHLKEIFKSGELHESSVIRIFRITATDGKSYSTNHYNLDAVISVGYRINSEKATKFRIWATKTLKEFIIKGFIIDDERLKKGKQFGKDYFDELLQKIKEIRASERRFYQKITDIYSQCSIDYDKNSDITKTFYATVQNKLHFATTGKTASEIIFNRADRSKENMGLTTWKNAPDGKILKSDTIIAKNYLSKDEISHLNDIVNMYLDYAENQAKRHTAMTMNDWIAKLDSFLAFNEYEILTNSGKNSHKQAVQKALKEFKSFRVKQDKMFKSDFDKTAEKYLKSGKKTKCVKNTDKTS